MKISNICTAVFSLALCWNSASACGFWATYEEYRFCLFQPMLVQRDELRPFIYTSDYVFEDGYTNMQGLYRINATEWNQAMGTRCDLNDIIAVLYHTPPEELERQFENSRSEFIAQINLPKNKEFKEYLYIIKAFEESVWIRDPWELNEKEDAQFEKVKKQVENLLSRTQNTFIRLRCYYQLLRLYFNYDRYDEMAAVYHSHIRNFPADSWVKASALHYMTYVEKDPVKRTLLHAEVFDKSVDKRSRSVLLFENKLLSAALQQTADPHMKSVLITMTELQNPGRSLHRLREIYQLDPANKDLAMLISREINKIEDWLYTHTFYDHDFCARDHAAGYYSKLTENIRADKTYAMEVEAFIEKVVREKKAVQVPHMQMALAYIQYINSRKEAALETLKNIDTTGTTEAFQVQYLITRALCDIQQQPAISAAAEKAFYDIVQRLKKPLEFIDNAEVLKDQFYLFIAHQYEKKGQVAKAMLTIGQSRRSIGESANLYMYKTPYVYLFRHATSGDYQELLNRIDQKNAAGWDSILLSGWQNLSESDYDWEGNTYHKNIPYEKWSTDKVRDYYSMYLIGHDSLEKALEVLAPVDSGYWNNPIYSYNLHCNPFFVNINHPHRTGKMDSLYPMSKPEVLKKLIALKNDKNTAGQALRYLMIGNAYFNMTYHGNAWIMAQPYWTSSTSWEMSQAPEKFRNDPYFSASRARYYYDLAYETSPDKGLAALSLLMSTHCAQVIGMEYSQMPDVENNLVAKAVAVYRKKHGDAAPFTQLLTNCSLYKDYINRFYIY